MAQTAAKRRSAPARRASGTKAAGKNGRGPARRAAEAVKPSSPAGVSGIARAAARKAIKKLASRALEAGAERIRSVAERTSEASRGALESGLSKRLPIQVSVDVAVPLLVAWEEWMKFESFTEGVHRIEEIERDGDGLVGRTAGPRPSDWAADILDEREQQSFAWRSVEGSDCAGLATFHQLSERLTRIELDLDVLPTSPGEAVTLSLHLAHRRAEAELRRFKARVEFINPDVYEEELSRNGSAPKDQADDE